MSKIGRTEDILKEVVENHKRQENYYFLFALLPIRAGYHFSNHAVKSPINIGIRLFTRISTFPNPAFLNRKVQIAVSTYSRAPCRGKNIICLHKERVLCSIFTSIIIFYIAAAKGSFVRHEAARRVQIQDIRCLLEELRFRLYLPLQKV